MHFCNHSQGYGLIAIMLHWFMAIGIIGLFCLGLWMTSLSYYDAWYTRAPWLHKSAGIIIAITLVCRICWRLSNPNPALPSTLSSLEKNLARWGHRLLYVLMLSVMISGYMISTTDGRAIEVFGWFDVPAVFPPFDNQEDIAGVLHFYLASSTLALATLHALAAFRHQFIDRDGTLTKMLNPF